MFFDGSAKSKRDVSLGGKTRKQVARTDLLKNAQEERRRREAMREKSLNASRIQAGYRGYCVRKHLQGKQRCQFDSKISELQDVSLDDDVSDLVATLTRQLLCFYTNQNKTDKHRLFLLCVGYIKHKERLTTFSDIMIYRLKKLGVTCCHVVSAITDWSDASSVTMFAMLLKMLELISGVMLFGDDGVKRAAIVAYVVENGWFSSLATALVNYFAKPVASSPSSSSSLSSSSSNAHVDHLLLLIFRPLDIAQHCDIQQRLLIYKHLASDVFSHSPPSIRLFLLSRINSSQFFNFASLLEAIAPLSDLQTEISSLTVDPTEVLLDSILMSGVKHLAGLPAKVTVLYLIALCSLLPTAGVASMADEEEATTSFFPSSTLCVDEDVWVRKLDDKVHVGHLLSIVNGEMPLVAALAFTRISYWMMVDKKQAPHQSNLLSGLMHNRHFIRAIWTHTISWSSTSLLGREIPIIQQLCCGSPFTSKELEMTTILLTVFSTLFYHSLFSLHDAEFYADQVTNGGSKLLFNTGELVDVSAVLRDVAIALLSDHATKAKKLQSRSTYQIASTLLHRDFQWLTMRVVQLLNQLYARDCRRRYCPDDHWLARQSSSSLKQFNIDVFFKDSSECQLRFPSSLQNIVLLTNIPYIFPFQERVKLFSEILTRDQLENGGELADFNVGIMSVTARRDWVYEDAFAALNGEHDLKKTLRVQLVNNQGLSEAGIDGGGIFREFLSCVLRAGFNVNLGLFCANSQRQLYPNPQAHLIHETFTSHYNFLGKMLAKALYERMLVELPLADFFVLKVLGYDVDVNHLASLDPELYRNLLFLKSYEGDFDSLALTFSVINDVVGETEVVELKPGGQDIAVTSANLIEYIHLMANYRLNKQINKHCVAFQEGFVSVVDLSWLKMFSHREFQTLISGAETEIDIKDLRNNTKYSGGFNDEHDCIQAFWRIVESFTATDKAHLLQFVTSCSRPPLLGFKELYPQFEIHSAGWEERLPTASTCMNLLKLPIYRDEAILRDKLLQAIRSNSGFELS
ncbi:ubiquitin-protein ligase E3C-like [Corticium candelabrum]|uniref:ubiquitin-protein ligase E3C-like n=1 Tax=Corticium candelabrum TaxID=121492 RepID=UPI002E25E92B|nr:ubiquitin-protein ligase E3C-like [Corticium candelabrum]